ncbi:carboxypeptidase regulatory-like domain-containing protein [Paraburkholderia strydomiana]|uniref:carboxypeptidase regulatory-like domain-containing protein n=1 Tax=Paraburkholderia strydomiana TaxID=1245417 RepID=UPI0038BC2049
MFSTVRSSLRLAFLVSASVQVDALAQSVPQPSFQNGISYITAGVGEDEVAAFRSAAKRYNPRMTLASKAGSYLSDVDVTITLTSGRQVLAVRTEGPFLFVALPAGAYRTAAKANHVAQTSNIAVRSRGADEPRFYWYDADTHGSTIHTGEVCPCSRSSIVWSSRMVVCDASTAEHQLAKSRVPIAADAGVGGKTSHAPTLCRKNTMLNGLFDISPSKRT